MYHIVMADGGLQRSGCEFKQFAVVSGFREVTPSPCYLQSTGLVKNCVSIIKHRLKEAAVPG